MSNSIDYIKQRFQTATIVDQVIYVNVAIFILTYAVKAISFLMKWGGNPLFDLFALPAKFNAYLPKFWTIFTYGFFHGGFWHILFNLLILYYIGNLFLDFFSRKQFITYFIAGIIAGGVIFLASYNYLPALKDQSTILVGASAGVTAIVIGLATKVPNYAIHLRFIGAIKLWHIALLLVLKDIIQLPLGNTGGHLAHLGGALVGFILTSQLDGGKNIINSFSNLFMSKKEKPLKTVYKRTKNQKSVLNKDTKQEKIDSILDKISKSGYDTLTKEEKDFLFSAGKNS